MRHLFSIVSLLVLASCGNNEKKEQVITESTDTIAKVDSAVAPTAPSGDVRGYYVGEFKAVEYKEKKNYVFMNRINISVDSSNETTLFGHSVVAGNSRPFQGPYKMESGKYVAEVKEPGEDKYDGSFSFTADPATGALTGTWKSYSDKLLVTKRSYTLSKKEFRYDPSNEIGSKVAGITESDWKSINELVDESTAEIITDNAVSINASVVKLKKEDVENMFKGDLEVMRNAIYARHGYSFKNRKIRYIFDNLVDWYIPVSTDVRKDLTKLEKENEELIKRYEEHADKYYDSWGR
jgi:hypothetical protein